MIKGIDKSLDNINFDVSFILGSVYLGLTADKDDFLIPGATLLEFEIENQRITLWK